MGRRHGPRRYRLARRTPFAAGPATDHRDERRQDDRVLARIDPRERLEIARDRPRPHAGGRLRPGVDHLEPHVAHQRGQDGSDVGVARPGHGEGRAGDPPCGRDGLLGHHPTAGPHRGRHHAHHGQGFVHVEQQEPAEGEIDLLGQRQVFARLGQRNDLGVGRGGPGHLVAGAGIAVDGVDPAVTTDHLGQGHRDVTPTRTDVDTAPAAGHAQPFERRGERTPVHVVAQPL